MIPLDPPKVLGQRRRTMRARTRLRRTRSMLGLFLLFILILIISLSGGGGGGHTKLATRSPTSAPVPSTTTTTTGPDGSTGVFATAPAVSYLKGRSGDITASLINLGNGQTSNWQPGVSEYTASIVKVDILATLLHTKEGSNSSLSTTEQGLATNMIEQSDDDAASSLWTEIGSGPGLAAFNQLVGLAHTQPGSGTKWGATETTAADQTTLLRAVTQPGSKVLDADDQRYELGLMQHVISSQDWGVSAGVPTGVTISLKNGWLPLETNGDWQVNSIGWIDGNGQNYLLAVLTKGQPTFAYGIQTIEGLSRIVWATLSGSPLPGSSSSSSSTTSTGSTTTTATTTPGD